MKVFLFIFLTVSICYSQSDSTKSVVVLDSLDRAEIYKAGKNLRTSTLFSYSGAACIGVGSLFAILSLSNTNNKDQTFQWVGIGFIGAGAILHLVAPSLIDQSGRLLMQVGERRKN